MRIVGIDLASISRPSHYEVHQNFRELFWSPARVEIYSDKKPLQQLAWSMNDAPSESAIKEVALTFIWL